MKNDISLRRINHQQLNINNQYVASRNNVTIEKYNNKRSETI